MNIKQMVFVFICWVLLHVALLQIPGCSYIFLLLVYVEFHMLVAFVALMLGNLVVLVYKSLGK